VKIDIDVQFVEPQPNASLSPASQRNAGR
jgi:hypothetical protein